MTTEPVSNTTLPLTANDHGRANGRGDTPVLETVLDFMGPGVSFEQAVQDALDAGAISASDLQDAGLADQVEQLPPGHQRQLADNAPALPPALREALEQAGLSRPNESSGSDQAPGAPTFRGEGPAALHGNAPLRGEAANAVPSWARGEATTAAPTVQASGTLPAQSSAAPAAPGGTEQARFDGPLLQGARPGEAAASARADALNPALNPDRIQSASWQVLFQQVVVAPQGRTDAMPAQVLPQAAGATVLASPHGTVLAPPNTVAPVPRGADALQAQARDAQLAPAGHTLAANLRRDRRGRDPHSRQGPHPAEGLLALLPGRRRRQIDGEEEGTSFHWLFWLLTTVTYGALAVAIIAMIPSGGALTDGAGRPGFGAYALIVGAIAAVALWFVGRRLSKR